jgi:predicted nucleic-acid-binding protein
MNYPCIDTNVIVRYLVETPQTINHKFKGVYSFFVKLEEGAEKTFLADIVLFQAYFVLTSYYEVPSALVAEKLENIVQLRGIHMSEKQAVLEILKILKSEDLDIVDAYLLAYSRIRGITGAFSYDGDLKARGLALLKME